MVWESTLSVRSGQFGFYSLSSLKAPQPTSLSLQRLGDSHLDCEEVEPNGYNGFSKFYFRGDEQEENV